jgi:hypothetical protein
MNKKQLIPQLINFPKIFPILAKTEKKSKTPNKLKPQQTHPKT